MKTNELTGAALDWAVAKCEGWGDWDAGEPFEKGCFFSFRGDFAAVLFLTDYSPSSDWAQGGPIIEREGIMLARYKAVPGFYCGDHYWKAGEIYGPTPLVAAMRCYVVSKLGDEVEIPKELQ